MIKPKNQKVVSYARRAPQLFGLWILFRLVTSLWIEDLFERSQYIAQIPCET